MSGQLYIWSAFGVRLSFGHMCPLVEASSGQEWYYVRAGWHLVSLWVRLTFGQMYSSVKASSGQEWQYARPGWHWVSLWVRLTFGHMCPPGRGIEWPRVILLQVNFTFCQPLGSGCPLVICTPGRGIEWPRVVLCQARLTCGQPLGQADLWSDVPPW